MVTYPLTSAVLQSVVDLHPDPITYHTPLLSSSGELLDFCLVYCNESQRRQAKLPVDDMIGQRVSELYGYSHEGRQLLLQQLTDVWTTGNDVENTYYNEVLDIFFHVHRRKVEEGVLTVAKNVNAEIYERREKERQIELSDKVLNTSLDSWFTCDVVQNENGEVLDFVFIRINPGFTRIIGLAEKNVLGKSYLSLFPSAKEQGSFDVNERVFRTGHAERLQMPYRADGIDAWFEVAVSKLGQTTILVTFDDITHQVNREEELRRTNELLNGILENSASGISFGSVIRDENGNIIDGKPILANEAALRFAGIPRELYFTKTAAQLEPNIRQSLYFQKIVHTMETGEPSMVEYQVETSGKWIQITLSRMDHDHLIIVYTDITESKAAQLRQEMLLHELQRSNRELDAFASAASHDLKEPIRKVHFYTERLKTKLENQLKEEEQALFSRIEGAVSRMKALVNDLLAYSQTRGGSQPAAETIDLNEKIEKILCDLELLISESGAVINVGTLPEAKGNRHQLQQLFQNLITNALKYQKPGVSPVISVRSQVVKGEIVEMNVRPGDEDKAFHLIEVEDNGIGFEQVNAERIFRVFTRLHGQSEYAGTGIGLAIAKQVVENHDGYLTSEGRPGQGATFRVWLPVKP